MVGKTKSLYTFIIVLMDALLNFTDTKIIAQTKCDTLNL